MKKNKRNTKIVANMRMDMLRTEYIVLLLITILFSLSLVSVKVEQIRIGYEISENSKLEKALIQKKQNLRAEYMQLRSTERMEYLAENMGFKFPTQDDVIFVETSTFVGNRK